MSARTAIVIGGGVIGLSTAYQLARRGFGRVVLLEKGTLGDGSSRRAAGITTGLLWSEAGVKARQVGLRLFRELGRTLPGYTFHDEQGCLNLFTRASWLEREKLLPLYDRLHVPYHILKPAEISRRWPELQPDDDHIGLHDPLGGYSEPPAYLAALAQAAVDLGVEIHEQESVTGWLRSGAAVVGVKTAKKTLPADVVVATVHAWTLPLLADLGVRPPVKHFVHQRYLSAPLASSLVFPPVNADPLGGYLRPAEGNRILMGLETPDRAEQKVDSADFEMNQLSVPPELRSEGAKRMLTLLPALRQVTWETQEVGLISFSSDGEPVLGPVSAVPGLFLGQGFHSGGFSYNPVAGLLLAEWVSEGRTSIDVSAFSPDRFPRAAAETYLASRVPQKHAVRRRH